MEERIDLQEPELVPMRPEERQEAVRLLAALIRVARCPPVGAGANRMTGSFPAAATGETGPGDRGGT
jgi:hypothetical protein